MHPISNVRRPGRLVTALVAAAAVAAGARTAAAQTQVLDLPIPVITPPPLTGDIEQGKRAFWRAGRERFFFAATGEVGNFFVRAGGAAGYGKPHWSWGGVEGSSAVSPAGGVAYGGLRFSSPWVDVRAGARYTFTSSQHYLEPRDTYTKEDTRSKAGPPQRYVTMEAEAASGFPVPRGAVFGIFGLYYVVGAPKGWNMFEQSLQVVAAPDLLWRARAGYLVSVDKWDMFRIGASVEVIGNAPRDLVVVRAGPAITALITHHFEAYGAALLVVHSRDSLGLSGGQVGELGFRYRWATGDRWPEFP